MGHIFVKLPEGVEHTALDGKTFGDVVTAGKTHVKDLTWQDLALYNWGTAEPSEVNRALRETIGCSAVDDKDPSKTKLAVKQGPKTTANPRLPKLWTQDGLEASKTHTIKVKKRVAAPAVAITELTSWFVPTTDACTVKYRLEGVEGRADKLDFEVHAPGYYELNKGGGQAPCATTDEKDSTHIFRKALTPDLKTRDPQTFAGWKGESQATKGVLASNGKSPNAAHHCAPYTVLLRYRKDDADKASIVLRPFAPVWKPAAAEPTDESLVVEWTLAGDPKRKLTRGLLQLHDKAGDVVFSVGLDRATLEGGKYDLAKDARHPWPKASVKKADLPYRVQLQAHSESDVEEGLALAAMHTLVRANLYAQVQFIACNIRPGYSKTTPKKYLGEADADKDMKKRADVMIEAIDLAAKDAKVKKDDASVLKVFMAPEFYWRGVDGAYPAEKLDSIIDLLRPETTKPKYADWLFVYGTAIGYLPHEQVTQTGALTGTEHSFTSTLHPGFVDHAVKIITVTTAETTTLELEIPDELDGNLIGSTVSASALEDEVTDCAYQDDTHCKVTLKGKKAFKAGAAAFRELRSTVLKVSPSKLEVRSHLCRKGGMRPDDAWQVEQDGETAYVTANTWLKDDQAELTLDADKAFKAGPINFVHVPVLVTKATGTTLEVQGRLCARIPADVPDTGDAIRWKVKQSGGAEAEVSKCAKKKKDGCLYELTIMKATKTFDANKPLVLVEPKTTEVLNVAFVQKGWPAPAAAGELRQVVVYKENVSHIDYMDPKIARTARFHDKSGLGRTVTIHGDTNRVIVPTDGAEDVLGASPNTETYVDKTGADYVVGSEVNHTGAGGGGVFTVDGVTFGLEVCRDHLVGRLQKFYQRAKKGDPKVQVLLVPSWGAWIQSTTIECEPNAPMFNVDGGRADSVARLNDGTWSCENTHPLVNKPNGPAPCDAIVKFQVCTTCNTVVARGERATSACATHGQAALREYHQCKGPMFIGYRCPLCRTIKDAPGKCHLFQLKEVHQCNYEQPFWWCSQCKGKVKEKKCTTHPANAVEQRQCKTCKSYYSPGEDCASNHDAPVGRCLKFYNVGENCSKKHGAQPVPCDEFHQASAGQCSYGHTTPLRCGASLTKVGGGQTPATVDIDVPGSHLPAYFETRGYVTVYDPLAIPPAKVV